MKRVTGYININGVPVDLEMPVEVTREEFQELVSQIRKLENLVTNLNGGSMRAQVMGIPAIITAVQRGEKIAAIKALREVTPGLGLKEAKDLIELGWSSFLAENANRLLQEPQF